MIYFDHNATTPLHPVARDAWLAATESYIGNPSSPHRIGGRADTALNDARRRLAAILGCDPFDIVWTSGATEANNMALHHFARWLPRDAEVWVSAIEHPCVLHATQHHFAGRHRFIPVTPGGAVDMDWLIAELADRRPGLVAVLAANNVTGVLQPWREILAICRSYGVPFFCDAVQWLGKLPAQGLGDCDFLSGCAHKCGGPRGIGFLKVPAKGRFHPLLLGGNQEEGRRAGTENVAGALSLTAMLEQREKEIATGGHIEREAWRAEFEREVRRRLPGSDIVASGQPRLWNTVSLLAPEAACPQRWLVKLDKFGFAVSSGSACSSGKEEPSHVLTAMGLAPEDASRALRLSSGWETPREQWHDLTDALDKANAEMQQPAAPPQALAGHSASLRL